MYAPTKAWLILLAVCATSSAFAGDKKTPPYGDPPYGISKFSGGGLLASNYLRKTGIKYNEKLHDELNVVAKHYGYDSVESAFKECMKTRKPGDLMACADPLQHRRNESAEVKKYGFKDWEDAVHKCAGSLGSISGGHELTMCEADPFQFLRKN
jgi:hypothetical protein